MKSARWPKPMRRTIHRERDRIGAIRVPLQHVEMLIALGYRLIDEPHCSGAYMVPPSVKDIVFSTTGEARHGP